MVSRARKRTHNVVINLNATGSLSERTLRTLRETIRAATTRVPPLVARYTCGHAVALAPRADADTLCHCGRGDLLGILEAAA